ncbi:sigma factor [Paenibacillus sp. KS-LC4]|uniref:RNA polymerase sigma factor n=1 Tax=Paenibacillus sp. KS-LC4 TaxID=2979727 RepID=UPI0030D20528
MSRAQDKKKIPALPEEQEQIQHFEAIYNQYRDRIRIYIAVKKNSATADDLTQQAFLKAMENFHLFKCNSRIFTWLFKIAQNIVNPGPEHTYQSVLRHTISLFTMWLVKDINPLAPKWLTHGLGGHEAKQMSQEYIQYSTSEAIQNNAVPSFQALTNDTWDFEKIGGYGFSHLLVEYLIHSYSLDVLNKFIRDATDFQGAFQISEAELRRMWVQYLKSAMLNFDTSI